MRKETVISVRLDAQDLRDLKLMASQSGWTPGQVLRQLIRNATIRPTIVRTELDVMAQREKEPA